MIAPTQVEDKDVGRCKSNKRLREVLGKYMNYLLHLPGVYGVGRDDNSVRVYSFTHLENVPVELEGVRLEIVIVKE